MNPVNPVNASHNQIKNWISSSFLGRGRTERLLQPHEGGGCSWLTLLHYLISETASEEDSSVPPCSRLNSESSVPEELGSLPLESVPLKVSENQEELGSPDNATITEEMVYTQEMLSAALPGKLVSDFIYHSAANCMFNLLNMLLATNCFPLNMPLVWALCSICYM